MLLFDQNISYRILKKLPSVFAKSVHVNNIKLNNKTDSEIWSYAKHNNLNIVTFDADFFDLANIYGHPPKIIWLRLGNTTTNAIAELLNSKQKIILEFLVDDEYSNLSCLEID